MFKGFMQFVRTLRWAPALLALGAAAQTAAPPPVEAFFATPKFGKAKLSPDGRWLVALNAPAGAEPA